MTRLLPVLPLILLLGAFKGSAQSSPSLQQSLDKLVNEAVEKDVFSGNVLVARHGQVLYERSVGYADISQRIGNTAHTRFAIGSITKIFTKILIHQLEVKGLVKSSNTLGTYLTGFPEPLHRITVQQLLDHTSGLGSYYDVPGYEEASKNFRSIAHVLEYVKKEPLQFAPGTQTAYSNSGYAVLAGIVEQVTGKPYGRVLEEMILTPLGMMQTTYALFNRNEPGKAVGYLSNLPGEMYDNNNTDMIGAGDGGISSTVADLHTLMISLMTDNRLLPNEKKVEIFNSPVFPVRYTSWQDVTQRGRLGVAGGSPGMNAVMALSMETGNQVVVLSNYDEGTAEEVYKRIQAVLQQKPVPPFQLPPARIIYNLIDTKGGLYFEQHYAAELTNAGVEISADDMPFLFAGRALIDEKRWQDACHLYTVYCKEYPRIVVAWNDLGDVNVELGKTVEARKCYEQALALRPGNERAKTALSKIKE